MNQENLNLLIERYEQGLDNTMGPVNQEQVKWEATKRFRDIWFSDTVQQVGFAEMFRMACSECSVMLDNSTTTPMSGIVKAAEHDPEEASRLFREVLFADDDGDLTIRQQHMDEFVEGMNSLIKRYYPKSWKYPQNRHTASCYLAFFAPEDNYIYQYSDAALITKHIEFGFEIGSGKGFNLATYYQLCDTIAKALSEHPTLLEKHAAKLDDSCYKDDSNHLMVFDFMYCCRTYGYYQGITYINNHARKASRGASEKAVKEAEREKARQENIEAAFAELDRIELEIANTEPVSLVGTQVSTISDGDGIVITQDENLITVQFSDSEEAYTIHQRYKERPTFEDDDEIVRIMSERADLLEQKQKIQNLLKRLQAY